MKLLSLVSWLGKAARWVWRIVLLRRDVDRLQERMSSIEASAPPRPKGFRQIHSIYWGLPEGSSTASPFCPNCASDSAYVPLTRKNRWANGTPRDDGQVQFTCPKCGRHWFLTLDQEGEALAYCKTDEMGD